MIVKYISQQYIVRFVSLAVFFALIILSASMVRADGGNLVRYINDQGNTVIDFTIPAEYVNKGYEIISASGKVIKKIPPAPTGDEIEKQRLRNELREEYAVLRKRYSSEHDIVRAKERRLEKIQASVNLQQSKIHSINAQMDTLVADAAQQERLGRSVPPHILETLEEKRQELLAAEEALILRRQELLDTEKKFDHDHQRFIEGKELAEQDLYK